jgi:SAM-dependent methyltransferase
MSLPRTDNRTFYESAYAWYADAYWNSNDGTDLCRPNGFPRLPRPVYDLFASQVVQGGKVLDLGCGNGLMLKYLVDVSPNRVVPYGVDWLERSIAQARHVVLPEFEGHFFVANLVDYDFADAPYRCIFVAPDDVHPDDREQFFRTAVDALSDDGRIVFYCYRDVLDNQAVSWPGDLHGLTTLPLEQIDSDPVVLGVFHKRRE